MTESGETRAEIQRLLEGISLEAQQLVSEVLRLEYDKLHMKTPQGIVKDLTDVVKAMVK